MWQLGAQADTLGRVVAGVLLVMSVCSWSVIVWKTWALHRARRCLDRSKAALWQSPGIAEARQSVARWDAEEVVLPLLLAIAQPRTQGLDAVATLTQRRTRLLREALQGIVVQLQSGLTLLATTAAVAPFVGLLGTVWGIYHALIGISATAQLSLDKIAGPVGESLVMTAAGLVVAIPAVVAYNTLGRRAALLEAALEGLALDLRDLPGGDGD